MVNYKAGISNKHLFLSVHVTHEEGKNINFHARTSFSNALRLMLSILQGLPACATSNASTNPIRKKMNNNH